jgi:MYXO-CTERM domain-containing protein
MTSIPTPWTDTLMGATPGFVNAASDDYRPTAGSPLVAQGTTDTSAPGPLAFVNPLLLPAFNPPERALIPVASAAARSFTGNPSIGAFEPNAAPPGPPPPALPPPPTLKSSGSSGGCKCRMSQEPGDGAGWLASVSAVGLALARRRRRR